MIFAPILGKSASRVNNAVDLGRRRKGEEEEEHLLGLSLWDVEHRAMDLFFLLREKARAQKARFEIFLFLLLFRKGGILRGPG